MIQYSVTRVYGNALDHHGRDAGRMAPARTCPRGRRKAVQALLDDWFP